MRSSRTLIAATLLAAISWLPAATRVAAQAPPIPQDAAKSTAAVSASKGERTGPPFGVVRDKQQEISTDLAIADGLGIKPIRIKDRDSIAKVAPGGRAFKWVLTAPPELELWAVPILDLRLSPLASNSDDGFVKKDVIKHVLVTRGAPVQSAGIAQLQGDKLVIDGASGHYQPSFASVRDWAVPAFKAAGFVDVEPREYKDRIRKDD